MNKDDTNLNSVIEPLIESLRKGIVQRGELLALQQEQQDLIFSGKVTELAENTNQSNQLEQKLTQIHQATEQAKGTMVTQMGLPQETTFEQMIDKLPEEYRPLLKALKDENNALVEQLNMWVKSNHQSLKRANDFVKEVVQEASSEQPPDLSGKYGAGTQAAPGCVVDLYRRPSPKGTLYEGVI